MKFLNFIFAVVKYFISGFVKLLKYLTGFILFIIFYKYFKKSKAEDTF